jgi:RNA polymerase sigma-70 factor (ECF subfamily)
MAAIARLPAAQRDVLVLRGVEGMAEADVAALLGITGKAVETRLYRARRALSEMLAIN